MNDRITLIKHRLTEALKPISLSINDDSAHHAGHEGAKGGAGHFTVNIVATTFEGKTPIQRHRLVYSALEGLIGPEIHAIQINAKSPLESNTTS